MAKRIVSVHAGIDGMGIYAIMLPYSGFSVALELYNASFHALFISIEDGYSTCLLVDKVCQFKLKNMHITIRMYSVNRPYTPLN